MRIERVAPKPDRGGRYTVNFADGSVMRLYRQTVEDYGIYPGLELTESQMEQLRRDVGQMSAKMRAVRIVTAANVSKKDLEQRLIQKGESQEQAQQAVAWMEELNLLDDRNTARQIVSGCIAKGYGEARAKQALYEKRIPKTYWEEALADYPDQQDKILDFLRCRLDRDSDPRQRKRAIDALLRRGHSYGKIRQALRQLDLDEDVFLED